MKLRKLISAITAAAVMATSFVFSAVPTSATLANTTVTVTDFANTVGAKITFSVDDPTAYDALGDWGFGYNIAYNDDVKGWVNGPWVEKGKAVKNNDGNYVFTFEQDDPIFTGSETWAQIIVYSSQPEDVFTYTVISSEPIVKSADTGTDTSNDIVIGSWDKYKEFTDTTLTEGSTITVNIKDVGESGQVGLKYKDTNWSDIEIKNVTANDSSVTFTLTKEAAANIVQYGGIITGQNYTLVSYTVKAAEGTDSDSSDGTVILKDTTLDNSTVTLNIDNTKLTTNTTITVETSALDWLQLYGKTGDTWDWSTGQGTENESVVTFSADSILSALKDKSDIREIGLQGNCKITKVTIDYGDGDSLIGGSDDKTDDKTDDTSDDPGKETVDKKSLYRSYGYFLNGNRWDNSYSGKILTDDPNATIDIYYDSATDSTVQIVLTSPANWWDEVYSYPAPAGTDAKLSIPVSALVALAEDSTQGTVHDPDAVVNVIFPTWSGIGSGIYKVDYNSMAFMAEVQQAEIMANSHTVYAPAPGTVIVDLTSTAKGNEQKLDNYYTKGDEGWVTTNDSIFRNPEARLVINYTDAEHDGWGDIGIVIEDEDGNKSQAVITTSQGANLETIVPITTALNKMEAAGGGAPADKGKIVGGSIIGWNGCVINKVEVIIDESKTLSKEEAAEAAAAPEAAIVEVADLNASGQLTVYSKDKTESILSDPDGILYIVYDNAADGGTISFGLPTVDKGWVQYDINDIAAGSDAEYQISIKALLAGLEAQGYKGDDDLNGQLLIQSWGGPVLKAAKYEMSEAAGAADTAEQAAAELGDVTVDISEPTGVVEIDATGAELAVALLDADDLEKVKNGAEFKVKITAEEVAETAEYKAAVDELVDNVIGGIFFDVEIFTQVGDDAEKQVTETNYPVSFTVYSDELKGFDGAIYGYRFHEGDIDEINASYDAETGAATLSSDKYSVFAIVLAEVFSSDVELDIDDTDTSVDVDDSADTGASAGVVDSASEEETNPHTGVALSGLAVLTAAGALAVLSKKRRK